MSAPSTSTPATQPAGWFFARGQRKGGPVSFPQLQQWAAAGKLLPSDRVLEYGGKEWRTADTVPGLFGGPGNSNLSAALPVAPPPGDESAAPANPYLGMILIGVGGVVFLLLGLVLVVVCLMGDFGRSAQSPSPEDPMAESAVAPKGKTGKPKPVPPALTPRQKEISASVDRGVAYLRKRMAEGGKFYAMGDPDGGAHPGAVALVGLTLLECGAQPSDPDVQKAVAQVRNRAPDLRFTYAIAVSILFLDRLNADRVKDPNPKDRALIRTLALRLIAGQNPSAGWSYFCRVLGGSDEQQLLERLQSDQYRVGDSFVSDPKRPNYFDNSIGQFVTLALWAARKHQVPVRAPLMAVERRYRGNQRPDGSWSYNDTNPFARDTSTCAALIGLAVGRGVRDEGQGGGADLLQDPLVKNGLKHLQRVVGTSKTVSAEDFARKQQHTLDLEEALDQFETSQDPAEKQRLSLKIAILDNATQLRGLLFDGDNWGDLYFLWSLERMAVIYDLKTIAEVDWHEWGTDVILRAQKRDGSWSERFPGVPDTCFALLFLKRANIVKDLTDKLRGVLTQAGAGQPPASPPGKRE
jgi:hypothetical protein